MKGNLFQADTRLSDMMMGHSALLPLLPRFGIPLGFGDLTAGEVCKQHNVDEQLFLLVCNLYVFDWYEPSQQDLQRVDLAGMVQYLIKSHEFYNDIMMPHIQSHFDVLYNQMTPRVATIFRNFFLDYKTEVGNHFDIEETQVFPYVTSLLHGKRLDYNIGSFVKIHGNIDEKLDDLTQIIFKYLPGSTNEYDTIEVVLDLLRLSNDLKKHTLIEDMILVPYVRKLEKKLK